MGQPKRKQSKQRSRKRRGANVYACSLPELAKDVASESYFRPHHVNPTTGTYKGRQVIKVEA